MKELIEDFRNGNPISDNDLDLLIIHYTNLSLLLKPHGEIFHLVYVKCILDLEALESYKQARKR